MVLHVKYLGGFAALHRSKLSIVDTSGLTKLSNFYMNDIDHISLLVHGIRYPRYHPEFHTCNCMSISETLYQSNSVYPNIACLYQICLTLL